MSTMEKIPYQYDLPVYGEYDVVVCGGGTAGVTAAMAAADNGASVVVLERTCALGGSMTTSLIQSLHGYRLHEGYMGKTPTSDWSGERVIVNKVCMELFNRLQQGGGTAFADSHPGEPSLRENIDEEVMIRVLEEMMVEKGVRVLYDSFVFDVIKDEEADKIVGVVFTNKSGPQVVKGKIVIDCSADLDVCAKAGTDWEIGDDTGRCHGNSLFMEIGGIDFMKFMNYLKNKPALTPEQKEALLQEKYRLVNGGGPSPDAKLRVDGSKKGQWHMEGKKMTIDQQIEMAKEGKFPSLGDCVEEEWYQYLNDHPETPYMPDTLAPKPMYPRSPRFVWYGLVRNGKVYYDQTMAGIAEAFSDCTNGEKLTDTMMITRKINWIYLNFLRERIPGFENAYVIKMSPLYGSRESRRVVGEYRLTLDDIQHGHWFEDTVTYGGYNNVHLKTGQFGNQFFIEPDRKFAIPYRCLVPTKVNNLLMAGRGFSKVEHARSAGMAPMMALGEAAGTAAALCVKDNVAPRDVNVRRVQEIMGIDLAELDADLAKNK